MFDPTRGVDVGTKQAIYALIRRFADEGGAIAIYSSELSELVHLCDRCAVVYRGRIHAEFGREALSEENLLSAAHGHAPETGERRAG
jgi:ribose transport system ATP-binding protein